MPDQPSTSGGIAERATALLAALGDTEDQVAASLQARWITGERGHCGTCPVAVYLLRSDLGCYAVDVDGVISLWFVGPDDVQHVEQIDLPAAIGDFIFCFDSGRYDDLVAGGAR